MQGIEELIVKLEHDIRSPLSMLQASINLIQNRGLNPDTIAFLQKNLPRIEGKIDSLANLLAKSTSQSQSPIPSLVPCSRRELEKVLALRQKPLRILAVDDEETHSDLLLFYLTGFGTKLQIQTCPSVEATLTALAQPVDLIFLDLDLGRGYEQGIRFLRLLKEKYPQILICVHSNHQTPENQNETKRAGADAFIGKPAAEEQVFAAVLMAL